MSSLIVAISFFLDGLLSIYQGLSLFDFISLRPMFTIASLIIIYPLCIRDKRKYYFTCLIVGLFYDLLYTNTLIMNMLLFVMLGYIIHLLYSFFKDNLINTIFITMIILSIYNIITFFILSIIGYISFNLSVLLAQFLSVLLTNILFVIILYGILRSPNIHKNKKIKSRYSL